MCNMPSRWRSFCECSSASSNSEVGDRVSSYLKAVVKVYCEAVELSMFLNGSRARGLVHGEHEARSYNGGLGAAPPLGSRGKAPGQGVRGRSPPEANEFLATKTYFAMKFLINLPIWSYAETIKIGYINQVDVDSLHITMQ